MSNALLVALNAEGGVGFMPFAVGGGSLLFLLVLLFGLLAFGKGREHS